MISGRGLGITGGTLDKLDAIPGFRTQLDLHEFRLQTELIGCAMSGATADLAPADRKLYALRDVTGTVESIPLITASILSKKLAESLDALVLDVKFGSGAFMATIPQALQLAESLVRVAAEFGVRTTALLTDMNQPLGRAVGNAVEVHESVEVLQGGGPYDVRRLTCELGAELLLSTGQAVQREAALARLEDLLASGAAYEKFAQLVSAQGGCLPAAKVAPGTELCALQSGWVYGIDGRALGAAVIELGGGRKIVTDSVDPSVGLEMCVRVGDHVDLGQPLLRILGKSRDADRVRVALENAINIRVSDTAPPPLPLITHRVTRESTMPWT